MELIEKKINEELRSLLRGRTSSLLFRKALEVKESHEARRLSERSQSRQLESRVREKLVNQGLSEASVITSLSHTHTQDGNWMIVIGSDQNIGVDLESEQRKVHAKLGSRLISASEQKIRLSVLEFWVIKEAAFKSNPQNHRTYLPQYLVRSWDEKTRTGKIQLPPSSQGNVWHCKFKLLKVDSWLISLAHTYSAC